MALATQIVDRSEIETYLGVTTDVDNEQRGLIEMIRQHTENLVRRFVGWDITQATYNNEFHPREYRETPLGAEQWELSGDDVLLYTHPMSDGDVIMLDNPHVTSVTDVREDTNAYFGQGSGDFAASSVLTSGTDYYLVTERGTSSKRGELRRIGRSWPSSPGTVRVTYVAGLTADELDTTYSDLKFAVLEEIVLRYKAARSRSGVGTDGVGVIQSKKIAGVLSVQYEVTSLKTMFNDTISEATQNRLVPYMRLKL